MIPLMMNESGTIDTAHFCHAVFFNVFITVKIELVKNYWLKKEVVSRLPL